MNGTVIRRCNAKTDSAASVVSCAPCPIVRPLYDFDRLKAYRSLACIPIFE